MPNAPIASRAKLSEAHERSHHRSTGNHPAFPHAMVLRLISCSPRRRIRLVTVIRGLSLCLPGRADLASANLAPATGARTTRLHRTQKAPIILHAADRSRGSSRPAIAICAPDALTSTASHPASVTIAIRPSVGGTALDMHLIWVERKQKYF